jgi:hypothetical protein
MFIQHELVLFSKDWGESNLNPMVRAWGLKKDRKAKCKSCVHYSDDQCKYRCPILHSANYRACIRYKNRKLVEKEN